MEVFHKTVDEKRRIRQKENKQRTQNNFRIQNCYINNPAPSPEGSKKSLISFTDCFSGVIAFRQNGVQPKNKAAQNYM